jgi:hypothetical protein
MQNKMQNGFYFSFCINVFSGIETGSSPVARTKIKTLAQQGFFHFPHAHQRFFASVFLCFVCLRIQKYVLLYTLCKTKMQNENTKRSPALY